METTIENQKQPMKNISGGEGNGKWVTSVSIRETITLSLPDSAVSCPDLEPISRRRWDRLLANNGHTHSHTRLLREIRLRQEKWERVYIHSNSFLSVRPVLKHSWLETWYCAYFMCSSFIWCWSLQGFFLFLVWTDGAMRAQAVVEEHTFSPMCACF